MDEYPRPTIDALREWGPDVGDPPDAKTRDYIHPDLERQVMEAIIQYPQSGFRDGEPHGLAAVAAVLVVEKWLLDHSTQSGPSGEPS